MKKFFSLMVVIAMVFSALPVLADDSIAEDVILSVKSKIEIPEGLTEFNFSENKCDDVIRFDFTWHDKDYNSEVYASSDSRGRIVNYNFYEQSDYSEHRQLIDYTVNDAKPIAESTIKKFYPEYSEGNDVLVLDEKNIKSSYSGRYKTFSFTFDRVFNGVKVNSNSVSVRIRATKDKIYVQSVSAALDEDAKLNIDGRKEIKKEDYTAKFPVKLYYATDYEDEKTPVTLFYSLDKGYVSLINGEEVKEQYFERYAGGVTEDDSFDEMESSSTANKFMGGLTKEEQAEVDKMASLVKAEDVLLKLRKIELLKITDDMKLNDSYTYKNDDKYFVNFTLKGEKRNLSASYNGETGEIIRINSYMTYYKDSEDDDKKVGSDSASVMPKDSIEEFVRILSGKKLDETQIEYTKAEEIDKVGQMNAERIVNGIPFPENGINVTYDMENNMVTRYNISWLESVNDFPKAEEAMSLEAAEGVLFEKSPMEDVLVNTKDGYEYALTVKKGITINAINGNEQYAYNEEKTAYTDIENHWAEEIINILFEHDIYIKSGKFTPDEAINQADMLTLFSACRDSGIIPIGWKKPYIAEFGVTNGYVDKAEPDKKMKRLEAFDAFCAVLGFGEVAKFDIYKSSYADLDATGSAEILKAMGILTGDYSRSEDYLTYAEAAVMVYRYLSK